MNLAKNPQALIDADAVCYVAASICQISTDIILENGQVSKDIVHLHEELGYRVIDAQMDRIASDLKPKFSHCILSNNDPETNYRYNIEGASRAYKANRKKKPHFLPHMRSYFINSYNADICDKGEADDLIGRIAYKRYTECVRDCVDVSVIMCGIDKDFKQFPGYFYNLKSREVTYSDYLGYLTYDKTKGIDGRGFLFFCAQMIMGDTSDNIVGIHKCGAKKAYDTLKDDKDFSSAWKSVVDLYRSKGIDDKVIEAHAGLLWITHKEGILLPHSPDIRELV